MVEETKNNCQYLPDTQPVTESQDNSQILEHGWGQLLPLGYSKGIIVLTSKEYCFGRDPSCEISISDREIDKKISRHISKYHFKIRREMENCAEIVYLEDFSSNGTFINKKMVGKNKCVVIKSQDVISVGKKGYSVFIYINSSYTDSWLESGVREKYQVLKLLGSGSFAEVKLVIDNTSCKKYAMKKILKSKLEDDKILNEINILKSLAHPNIIQMVDVVKCKEAYFLILEYMPDGDLQTFIAAAMPAPSMTEIKFIFYQIILGLQYLHNQGVTHRDLKPENILLNKNGRLPNVKISDFGLAKLIDSHTELRTSCGTLMYVAPEVLAAQSNKSYTNKADIWSSGVILFYCLSCEHPFIKNLDVPISKQISSGNINKSNKWKFICKLASGLVDKMLVVNPNIRISIPGILSHDWMKDYKLSLCGDLKRNVLKENSEPLVPSQYKKLKVDCC